MVDENELSHGNGDGGKKLNEPVVALGQRDIRALLSPGDKRRQSMQGFDDEYVDIVDYIVRGTYKIWEQKGLGRIYDHYLHNVIIHTSDRVVYGRDQVISDSTKTMAAFPDVRLYADDVIWSGNDQEGFHSSHRIVWVGHNTGYSIYGPPTGRKIVRTGIAHCFVKENLIIEEWIARDELALVRQLGFDEHELARRMAAKDAARGIQYPGGEVERVTGQDTPEVLPPKETDSFDIEDFLRRSLHEIWNWRLLNKIDEHYVDNYVCYTSANRKLYGLGDYKAHVLSLLAAFPDARMTWTTSAGSAMTRTDIQPPCAGRYREPTKVRESTANQLASASTCWASPTARCAKADSSRSG